MRTRRSERFPVQTGNVSCILLFPISRTCRFRQFERDWGNAPSNLLPFKLSDSSLQPFENVVGMNPVNWFLDKSKFCTPLQKEESTSSANWGGTLTNGIVQPTWNVVGMNPVSWFLDKSKTSKFLKFPISLGIIPLMLQLDAANLEREVDKFPMESGRIPFITGLLLISNFFNFWQFVKLERNSNSWFGDSTPVKLFSLRPRNCRCLRLPKSGMGPVNELLLKSISVSWEALVIEVWISPVSECESFIMQIKIERLLIW